MHTLDTRIHHVTASRSRALTLTAVGATVLVSQLALRLTAAPDAGASEAEEFGASIAEGIVAALSAPLVYASTALLLVFGVLAVVHSVRRNTLLAQREQQLLRIPPPPGYGPAVGRPWQQ